MDLQINRTLRIPLKEIEFSSILAQGAGGQNVNKVATAIQLRFDIHRSTLPPELRQRLLESNDSRLTRNGVIVIKAQRFRTRERNREDALDRLRQFICSVAKNPRPRKPTRPSKASRERRLTGKSQRSLTKSLRGRIDS